MDLLQPIHSMCKISFPATFSYLSFQCFKTNLANVPFQGRAHGAGILHFGEKWSEFPPVCAPCSYRLAVQRGCCQLLPTIFINFPSCFLCFLPCTASIWGVLFCIHHSLAVSRQSHQSSSSPCTSCILIRKSLWFIISIIRFFFLINVHFHRFAVIRIIPIITILIIASILLPESHHPHQLYALIVVPAFKKLWWANPDKNHLKNVCSALPFNTYQYYTPFVPTALKLYTVYTEAWFFHLSIGGASRMQLVPDFRGSGISWWLAHKEGWGTPKVHGADVYWCHLWCPIRKLHNVENHDDDPMRITDTRLASMSTEIWPGMATAC